MSNQQNWTNVCLQVHPKRLGPKRATKIRRFFGLSKEDDVSALSYEALLLFASQHDPSKGAG